MHTIKIFSAIIIAILLSSCTPDVDQKFLLKLRTISFTKLLNYGIDPLIVDSVKNENKKRRPLSEVKSLDDRWEIIPANTVSMRAFTDSECGRYLKHIQKSEPFYTEIFVMDKNGGNVCMTGKTSDYWQGDEAKFIKAYQKGKGDVYISDVIFDKNTDAYVIQVSVPIIDGRKAIGAMTFSIDVDKFKS